MLEFTSESVFLVSTGLLHFFCLHRALQSTSPADVRSRIGRYAGSVHSYIRTPKKRGVETLDPIDRHVINKMKLRQQEAMSSLLGTVRWALSAVLLLTFWNVLIHAKHWHSAQQDFLVCIGTLFVTLLPVSCGGMGSPKAVYICHGLIMFFTSLWVQLSDATPSMVIWSVMSMTLVRLAMSSAFVNVEAVVFWNFICSLADLWKFTATDRLSATSGMDLHIFSLIQATVCFSAVLSSAWLRADASEQFRREGVWRSHDLEHSASRVLLEHFCEVSVSLDSTLKITTDAKCFAAILKFDKSLSTNETDIQRFMNSDHDRALFRDAFSNICTEKTSRVDSVNVFMRDGNGSKVRFEMVGVAFANLDGATSYVVGIREQSGFESDPIGKLGQMRIRCAKKPLFNGTPSTQESMYVGNYLPDLQSRLPMAPPTLATRCLAVPRGVETPLEVRQVTLLQTISSWNVSTSRTTCCALHACLPAVKLTLESLARFPCQPGFYDADVEQCRKCSLLDSFDDENRCTSCGSCNERICL
eukprot:TRINITY_DN6288_c0_g4_i1.p1 TRINITY_DN6288_c0_g4~~TRINITY_DN6288_c0_g4_i1.p1  ORF type:complete len:529 (-),score=40.84 TRINITY_DN6288_c0_g4_i1:441-2027(-)